MKVLLDLTHPADPYIFRNLVERLRAEGHEVRLTGRDKDILVQIFRELDWSVEVFGVARRGALKLGSEMLQRQWKLQRVIREFRPDAILSVAGTFIAPLGRLFGIPTYIFYDTEHATISNLLSYPFATCTYVPTCYRAEVRWRHVRYPGYQELAYLHPNHFRADAGVLKEAGLAAGEPFTIARFVSWGAGHDIGLTGFTEANKVRAIREFKKLGKVFISSEVALPPELEPHRLRLPVTRVHDLMAHAALVFGESATMASEGAVLGVPGIFVDPVGRGYTDEQEQKYGLVFNFTSERQEQAIEKGIEILTNYDRGGWEDRRQKLLADKIDVAEFIYQVATKGLEARPG